MSTLASPTTNQLIDTHCHLDFDEFAHDRSEVLADAKHAGVNRIIVPAVSAASWHNTIELCRVTPSCSLALGLHPMFIDQHQPDHLSELDRLLNSQASNAVAVGEIGLDFYPLASSDSQHTQMRHDKQVAYFTKQLIIAKRADLPVIIHNRKAHDQCISLLRDHSVSGGIIHAFNGSIQQAHKYIELGFALGFGGMLTFARSNKLRALASAIPLEHIVLETDAPDMTVQQHRGNRNSPAYLPYVLQALAAIKGLSEAHVAAATTANAKALFRLS